MKQYIMLLRHGKAIKNMENRHGGIGSSLVPEGIIEINELCRIIIGSEINFTRILYSNRKQCSQTASILNNQLKVELAEITNLEPISLGILDGLSEVESNKKYSEFAKTMDQWRNGTIEINQLNIPGITDFNLFFKSGISFIDSLNKNDSYIIIATRSNLVLLANIMLGNNPEIGGGYKEIPWKNAGFITFEVTLDKYSLTSLSNISI